MEHATYIKAGITAFCAALAALLGWRGILAMVWVAAMLLDYLSGTCAAMKNGNWSSKVARQGLWHKAGMVLAVLVAALADLGLNVAVSELDLGFVWPGAVLPIVLLWYTLTELGSVLENVVVMGAPVPSWLTKVLKVGMTAIDSKQGADKGTEEAESNGD